MPVRFALDTHDLTALRIARDQQDRPGSWFLSETAKHLKALGLVKLGKDLPQLTPAGLESLTSQFVDWEPDDVQFEALVKLRDCFLKRGSFSNMKTALRVTSIPRTVLEKLGRIGVLQHSRNGYMWDTKIGNAVAQDRFATFDETNDPGFHSLPETATHQHGREWREQEAVRVAAAKLASLKEKLAAQSDGFFKACPQSVDFKLSPEDTDALFSIAASGTDGIKADGTVSRESLKNLQMANAVLRVGIHYYMNPRVDVTKLLVVTAWPDNRAWSVLSAVAIVPPGTKATATNVQGLLPATPTITRDLTAHFLGFWQLAGKVTLLDGGVYQCTGSSLQSVESVVL